MVYNLNMSYFNRVKLNSTAITGTFSYLDAGGEQTVLEITTTTMKMIYGIWLDLVNMTQNGTIKFYYKVDGTNYREVNSQSFTVVTDSDGFFLNANLPIKADFKITYTEAVNEGAARNIPFSLIYSNFE